MRGASNAALALALALSACGGSEGTASGTDGAAPLDGSTVDAGSGVACGTPTEADPRTLPPEVTDAVSDLTAQPSRDWLEVYLSAASPLSPEQVLELRRRACDALTFDVNLLGIGASSTSLSSAIRVVILSDANYVRATDAEGTYGLAFPADDGVSDAVALPESAFDDLVELDDTLAHELTHVLQGRLAPNDLHFPWYFIEGLAIDVGSIYGKMRNDQPTSFVKPWVAQASGSDAQLTFMRYGEEDQTTNLSQVGHNQSLAGFFVEYLRTKQSTEFPNAPRNVLELLEATSDGASLSAAFASHFQGVGLSDAQAAYIQFLNDTKGNLTMRFGGTVFE